MDPVLSILLCMPPVYADRTVISCLRLWGFLGHLQVSMKHARAGMCSPPDSIPLLQLMVQLLNAKKIVEVGVFTGG